MVGGFGAAACFGFVDLPEGTQPLIQDTRAPTAPRARRVHLCAAAGPAGPGRFFRLGPLRFDDTVWSFDPFAWQSARAGNRRFGSLSALCAHTKAPYKMDFNRKTLMALNRPGTARTDPR